MDRAFPMRMQRRRGRGTLRGLGYPILPDNWPGWSFSPGTPDAIQMEVLSQSGASLPPDLQAKWDAAQGTLTTNTQPAPVIQPTIAPPVAVTPSGAAISTQTGAAVTIQNTMSVPGAPGVFQCFMSDDSWHYCDQNAHPISYTPPVTPATTPAAGSQPTAVVSPAVTPTPATVPATTPVAVTASGAPISTTTGTPAPTSAAVVSSVQGTLDSLMTWLEGSLIGGVPNWLLLGGAAAAFFMFSGPGGSPSRRR